MIEHVMIIQSANHHTSSQFAMKLECWDTKKHLGSLNYLCFGMNLGAGKNPTILDQFGLLAPDAPNVDNMYTYIR